jgi:type IV pilus assembly protein PilE
MRGFSLVELVMVITLVGILSSLALNTYRSYVIDGCRTDGKTTLEKVANEQEQFYFDFNRYAASIASLPVPETSSEGHYRLSSGLIDSDPNTYRATAVKNPSDSCLPDHAIQYRLDHTGLREHKLHSGSWEDDWK